jgi:hypothetical protein
LVWDKGAQNFWILQTKSRFIYQKTPLYAILMGRGAKKALFSPKTTQNEGCLFSKKIVIFAYLNPD